VPVMFSYWAPAAEAAYLAAALNDDIALLIRQHPERFVGLGTVPLQDVDLAIKELERCMSELQLAGVEIGTHIGSLNLDTPALWPFFERAAELDAAVFMHPWDMLSPERMDRYWLSWLIGMPAEAALAVASLVLGGILERLPTLRVGVAHGGGAYPGLIGRIQHGYDVRPDLVAVGTSIKPWDQLHRVWVDSLVHDPQMLTRLTELFGRDRVFIGTDYPFPLGDDRPLETVRRATDSSRDPSPLNISLTRGAAEAFLGMAHG